MQRAATRKTYLDALRVLACLCVIYNHVSGQSMRLFSGASGAAALFVFFLSKSAVALFLMISGAVLLGRCDSYRKIWLRMLRVLLTLVLFSAFYYGMDCLKNGAAFELPAYLALLAGGRASNALWYLSLYLGVLAALPLLQRLSLRLTRADYRYFIAWALLFAGVMPTLGANWPALQLNGSFQLVLFSVPLGLVLLGRYADASVGMNGRRALLAVAAAVLLAAAPTVFTLCDTALHGMFDNYFLPFATGTAACLFLAVKWLDTRLPQDARLRGAVSRLGRLTFCTYLISDFLIEKLQFIREALVPALRVNGAGVAYVLIVMAAGLAVSAVLTRVPGLKKLL